MEPVKIGNILIAHDRLVELDESRIVVSIPRENFHHGKIIVSGVCKQPYVLSLLCGRNNLARISHGAGRDHLALLRRVDIRLSGDNDSANSEWFVVALRSVASSPDDPHTNK